MHSRSTIVLWVIAAAMFLYIAVFEPPGTRPARESDAPRIVLPGLDPDRVTALTIVRSNTTVRLQRVDRRWQLADPPYPAMDWLVEDCLKTLATLRRSTRLEASDIAAQPGGLTALGLEPPRASVVVEQPDRSFEFAVGGRTPLGNTLYLRLAGQEGVEVAEAGPLDRLPAGAAGWRDPQFLFLSSVDYDRIEMRSASREYALERDPISRRWRLSRPRPARADHGRVEQLLQQLQAARIEAFADVAGTADLEPFGLQPPETSLTFAQGTNEVLTVDFGLSPTNAPALVFVRRSTPGGMVLVPRAIQELVAVPYADLLDYRLVDQPVEQLGRIEIRARESFVLERGTNGVWDLKETTPRPTDPGLVGAFLDQLRGLRVADVAKEVVTDLDLPNYGLAAPAQVLTLQWTNSSVETGIAPLRLDFGGVQQGQVFVRRSDEVPVYTVALEDAAALPRAAYELRDRRLWQFTTNDVLGVTLMIGGTTNRLVRSPRGQWSIAPGSQGMVNTFAMEEALHRLGTLRARFWVARGLETLEDYGIPQREHRLAIDLSREGATETLRLAFGATSPSGGPYAATLLEGDATVFECPLDVFYPYDEAVRTMMPPGSPGR
jgi:hypothetical protein